MRIKYCLKCHADMIVHGTSRDTSDGTDTTSYRCNKCGSIEMGRPIKYKNVTKLK